MFLVSRFTSFYLVYSTTNFCSYFYFWKEIQPVHPKGDHSWVFIGRTDVEAETPVLWPPDGKNWLVWKDSDAGKDWRQEEKGTTEDEMVGWHHRLNGHEFEQALGDGEGQGSLACCRPWGHKELDTTEWLKDKTLNTWLQPLIRRCCYPWFTDEQTEAQGGGIATVPAREVGRAPSQVPQKSSARLS